MKKSFAKLTLLSAFIFWNCVDVNNSERKESINDESVIYVALGNSLTAGMQNSGLKQSYQLASYPALLAKQMGVEEFNMPIIDTPGISTTPGFGPLRIDFLKGGLTQDPLTVKPENMLLNKFSPKPYSNLGIPGATTKDFLYATGSINPSNSSLNARDTSNKFFDIVLRGNTTCIRQAIAQKPSIITVWMGNNDILGGVLAGTIIEGVTVTPSAIYANLMNQIIDSLINQTSAQIFIATIPDITTIPFVTTVPPILLDSLMHPVVVDSHYVPLLTEEDSVVYVTLLALTKIKGDTLGIPKAFGGKDKKIPAYYTLTKSEAATASRLVKEYNDHLNTLKNDRVTIVDMNQLLKNIGANQIANVNGFYPLAVPTTVTSKSIFSYDGVHPNSLGYKLIANEYLKAINAKMKTNYVSIPLN